jgi:dipeptidyl aminopeptidase/acylaminoacyl peptidase
MSMLQANQRHVTGGAQRGGWARRLGIAVLAMLVMLLAACADDESGRQFANDPKTPRPTPTAVPGTMTPADEVAPARPAASPQTLVDRRGAPDAGWWLFDGALWAIGDGQPRAVVRGDVLAFAPAPDGRRVAAVTESGGVYRIDIYALDGERVERFDDVLRVPRATATPVAAGAVASPVMLDWSPQGSRLLLAHASGVLVDVPFDGEPRRIETRVPLERIAQAAWSPRGDAIAVLTRDERGGGSLALVDPAVEPAPVDVIAPVGQGADGAVSVEAFEWKPRGGGIVFIQATRSDDGPQGGMVVAWDRSTNSTRILATGGQGGPTGSVTWISVAPDGKAVAYIVSIPGGDGASFVGLFVRSMIDGQLYRVQVDVDATVLRTWWLRDGLAWAVVMGDPAGAASVQVSYIDAGGDRTSLGAIGARPGATPMASPVAGTPQASPVAATAPASPAASPVASLMATPAT